MSGQDMRQTLQTILAISIVLQGASFRKNTHMHVHMRVRIHTHTGATKANQMSLGISSCSGFVSLQFPAIQT